MAKKKNVTISNDTENDESSIYNEMTKGDKSILDFSEVKKEDVEIWYSTGSFILDTMITNSYRSQEGKLLGGVSGGKITLLSGLESCVTEDTLVDIKVDDKIFTDRISNIKSLLEMNKEVSVLTKNNEFTKVLDYIEKGKLTTYKVILNNGYSIKVTINHVFYTKNGWKSVEKLTVEDWICVVDSDEVYCKVDTIKKLKKKHNIVDISVDHPEECYFGNGMLNHNTGKSMLAAHFIAEAQKKGAMCMYFDTEQRLNQTFFRDMGVDFSTNKLILSDERVIQKIFAKIEKFILTIKESKNPKRPAIVVIDSIAGSTTLQEEDEKFEDPSFGTLAKEVSRGLRKIAGMLNGNNVHLVLTNQLRFNMNKANKYADDYVDITGAALKFWNSLHFRLVKPSKADRIFNKKNQQIGVLTKLKFNKNSYGCPQPDVELPLYYGRGIDEDLNWLNFFKEKDYVVVRGQSATIKIPTLPEEKIELKSWKVWLHSDNDRYEKLKEIIANEIYVDLYSDDFTEEVYELSDVDKVDNILQPTTVVNSVEEIPMMN